MIEFNNYLQNRLNKNKKLEKDFWVGYEDFKFGVLLKEARIEAGLTQEELAKKLKTTKSAISRIENHAEDIRLSTIEKFLLVLDKKLKISIV